VFTARYGLNVLNKIPNGLTALKDNNMKLGRVAANILNKQSRTADEGWSSILVVGRGANNASP